MSKIKKLTVANMQRNWLNIPHVTQFDDADITDLEEFRKGLKAEQKSVVHEINAATFLVKSLCQHWLLSLASMSQCIMMANILCRKSMSILV